MTPTNINFTPKKYAGGDGLDRSPSPSTRKNTSGMEVSRTPDVRLRFVGFNFGHVQLLRLVVVMVWSYSFGHLELVK